MTTKFWTAAAVVFAVSGAVVAGDMSSGGGAGNPASGQGVKTPSQPNETQPGMMSGAADKGHMKADKGARSSKGTAKGSAKGELKGDAMSGGSGMQAGSGSGSGMSSGGNPNPGNPAEKGVRTPSQPNETQPGMGSKR